LSVTVRILEDAVDEYTAHFTL